MSSIIATTRLVFGRNRVFTRIAALYCSVLVVWFAFDVASIRRGYCVCVGYGGRQAGNCRSLYIPVLHVHCVYPQAEKQGLC